MTHGSGPGSLHPMSTDTSDKPPAGQTASFGFREVAEGARQGLVNDVFANVAAR